MSRWQIDTNTREIQLSDGDWITVKMELTEAEEQQIVTAGYKKIDTSATELKDVDWSAFYIEKVLMWVVDWSAKDAKGRTIPLTREAIRILPKETSQEIRAAIDAHVEEQAELKKVTPIDSKKERKSS